MKICIWGNLVEALSGNTQGGGELQLALIAKALAKGGNEVVIIGYDTPKNFIPDEGIKIVTIEGWNKGVKILRTFTHRLPKLYKRLREQNADIYYCRIRDFRHILAYWAARRAKGKFVLAVASDLDVSNIFRRIKYQYFTSSKDLWSVSSSFFIELIQPILLRKADMVLVQHEGQKKSLDKKNIKSIILPNLFDGSEAERIATQTGKDFIHVGSLDRRKGFLQFCDLVQKTPLHSYKVVGLPRDKATVSHYNKLKELDNVTLLGRLSHTETLYQISDSKALISTSPMEGFPNVFIEAWACGVPVLSLYFDPGVIEKEKLGKIAGGNLEVLIQEMETIERSEEFAKRAKFYVEQNHILNKRKVDEITALFHEISRY